MAIALYLLSLFGPPDVPRLGHPEWREREAEFRRCDNPFAAILLPRSHPDAEVNARLRELWVRNVAWREAWVLEQLAYRDDFPRWVAEFFAPNRSRLGPREVFDDLHGRYERVRELLKAMPAPEYMRGRCLQWDWDGWNEYLDYHRKWKFAPMPHEVKP